MGRVHWWWIVGLLCLAGAGGWLVVVPPGDGNQREAEVGDRHSGKSGRDRHRSLRSARDRFVDERARWEARNAWWFELPDPASMIDPGFHIGLAHRGNRLPGIDADLRKAIDRLGAADLEALFVEWTSAPRTRKHGSLELYVLLPVIVGRWAETAPEDAWEAVTRWEDGIDPKGVFGNHSEVGKALEAVLCAWAKTDPVEALKVFRESPRRGGGREWERRSQSVLRVLTRELAAFDPTRAWKSVHDADSGVVDPHALTGYYQGLPADWDWEMEVARFPDLHAMDAWSVFPDKALAESWVQDDPGAAIAWYVARPTPRHGSRLPEALARNRTVGLLVELSAQRPRSAAEWIRSRRDDRDRSQPPVVDVLERARTIQAVTTLLPLIESENERFAFLRKRARQLHAEESRPAGGLQSRNIGELGFWQRMRDGMFSFEKWTVDEVRAASAVANLTPGHLQELEAMIEPAGGAVTPE